MLLRHFATTMTYTLFSFGHERRLSLTALADGFVTVLVTASLAWFTELGVTSAALGSLAGVVVVSVPATGLGLARALGVKPVAARSVRFAAGPCASPPPRRSA